MRPQALLLFIGCFVACLGCGGGGGGGNDIPVYAGAWQGGVSLVSNSCPRTIPDEFQFLSILHNVDQAVNEDASGTKSIEIVLTDGIDTYVGLGELDVNGEGHSFSATGTPHELPGFLSGFVCIETLNFDYQAIDFVNETAGFVARHSSITCTKGATERTCDVTYTGSAYRTANPAAGTERKDHD